MDFMLFYLVLCLNVVVFLSYWGDHIEGEKILSSKVHLFSYARCSSARI